MGGEQVEEEKKEHTALLRLPAAALLGWIVLRWLGPVLLPFLLAWLTATLLEPVVLRLRQRFGLKRGFASGLCAAVTMLTLLGLGGLAVSRALWELGDLMERLPESLSRLPELAALLESAGGRLLRRLPAELRDYAAAAEKALFAQAAQVPGQLSAWLLGRLASGAKRLPRTALFAATYAVGVFFLSTGYCRIRAFLLCQFPPRLQARLREGCAAMRTGLGKWLRAQLLLAGLMFLMLLTAFLLLRVPSPLLLAAFTALVDALPVLGTGTVLVPWALWEALTGRGGFAAALLGVWLASAGLRSAAEPRLVGKQSGLNPAAALLAAYGGWHFFGVTGLVGFPLLLVMLKEVNDSGVLRLWRLPE